MNEKDFQRQVCDIASIYGWLWHHETYSVGSKPGFPDLVMTRSDRTIFAELKTDSGKLTKAQQTWREALCENQSVEYYLWRPRDWNSVLQILE